MSPYPVQAVVVGVDDSAASTQAVRLAAGEALGQQRPLCLLHAFNWMPVAASGEQWSRHAAEQLLARAEQAAQERAPGVQVMSQIVEGSPLHALRHASRNAALIVIGDGGLAGYVTLPVESTAMRVAAEAECSVIVVRDQGERPGPVLVGVDGTAHADQALGVAFDIAAQRRTELVIMHVDEVRKDGTDHPSPTSDSQREAMVAQWRQKYPGVVTRQRHERGDPARLLVEAAGSAALAVVGARGERPSHGMLGPVCLSVLHHAPCPVVIVRGRHRPTRS
ncbi:MAG TPA: universal stress protein [Micromonosporaceae bacterium]|nr:universal stress protein [Micromonosporaceae bacterium]